MAEFDPYSTDYRHLVTQSVKASGEPTEYFAAYKAKYIKRKFGSGEFRSVLDYGCGVGALADQLKLEMPGARVDGFDLSQHSLDYVSPQLRDQGSFCSDLDLLPADYDLVVIANVLHHVRPINRGTVLEQIFEKLRPDGRVVVFEHNPYNPLTRWAVSQCPFDGDAILLRCSEVRGLLWRAGFGHLQRDFIVFFPRALASLRSLEFSLRWFPLGAQFAFSGVRPQTKAPNSESPARCPNGRRR
jgi:SAM-dependent methyltransferase